MVAFGSFLCHYVLSMESSQREAGHTYKENGQLHVYNRISVYMATFMAL